MWFWKSKIKKIEKINYDLLFKIIPSKNVEYKKGKIKKLRVKLKNNSLEERKQIVSYYHKFYNPLMEACAGQNIEVCEFLINYCNVDIEQRDRFVLYGDYKFGTQRFFESVNALWCAIYCGYENLEIIELLLKNGANIHAICDDETGCNMLQVACISMNLESVKIIVENGGDISHRDKNGKTCLMKSIYNVEVCKYLLENGADLTLRDNEQKTVLDYAVENDLEDTFKELINHGAEVNNHILQIVCLKKAEKIINYLTEHGQNLTKHDIANAYELMGSMFLKDYIFTFRDPEYTPRNSSVAIDKAKYYSNLAARFRTKHSLVPKITYPDNISNNTFLNLLGSKVFKDLAEFSRENDLNDIATPDELKIPVHSYSIRYRVLYLRRDYVWLYLSQVIITSELLCTRSDVYWRLIHGQRPTYWDSYLFYSFRFTDLCNIGKMLIYQLVEVKASFETINPKRYFEAHLDTLLQFIIKLFYHLMDRAETILQNNQLKEFVQIAVRSNLRSSEENTFLHLTISKIYELNSTKKLNLIKLLVECGAGVNSLNGTWTTPLIMSATLGSYEPSIVKLLLESGGDLFHTSKNGEQAYELLTANPRNIININDYKPVGVKSLMQLAVTCIRANNLTDFKSVPKLIANFIKYNE